MDNFITQIANCAEEDLERLVIERAIQLEEEPSTERKFIIPNENPYAYKSFYQGFIKKDVGIYNSIDTNDGECFILNDYEYLVLFFKFVKENNGFKNNNAAMRLLVPFLDEYFGEYCGEDMRNEYIKRLGGNIPVSEYKNKGLAACSERAAIANNVMAMLGLKTFYITGYVNGQDHAYNIIQNSKGEFIIVDTTSCCGIYDMNNNFIGKAMFEENLGVLDERLEGFLFNGKELRIRDRIIRERKDGALVKESNGKAKKYSVEPILLEELSKSKTY